MSAEIIGFVPARGGSKRIPRKNLAQVHGMPLVARTIRVLKSAGCSRVIVSTDDDEIATVARLHGGEIDYRPEKLAADDATIGEVVLEWLARNDVDVLVVAEPTCALLRATTVADAIEHVESMAFGSVAAVHPNRQLLRDKHGRSVVARANSTHFGEPDYYYETGLFAMKAEIGTFLPEPVEMMVVDEVDALDIDEYGDLARARAGGPPAMIEIRYIQGTEIGSGHMRRAHALARELEGHHVVRAVEDNAASGTVPDLLVFDCLDVPPERIKAARELGVRHVVTFDNLASGGAVDLNFCELATPEYQMFANQRVGARFAILRPEFQGHAPRPVRNEGPYTIALSFGGTDPTRMTHEVLDMLMTTVMPFDLRIVVVAPPLVDFNYTLPDAAHYRNREPRANKITLDVKREPCMAEVFLNADLAITSNGLTVHEAAACFTPVIAVAVNDVEVTHRNCPGVLYLGNGVGRVTGSMASLNDHVRDLLASPAERFSMARDAYEESDGRGAERVAFLLDGLLSGALR